MDTHLIHSIYLGQIQKVLHTPSLQPPKYVKSIPYKLPYDGKLESDVKKSHQTIHIGQLKLFLSELQFLTNTIDMSKKYIIVYAGAAPSNHTALLFRYFNNIKFILVDPNQFSVIPYKHIKPVAFKSINDMPSFGSIPDISIINTLFTDDTAKSSALLAENHNCILLFISDIRTSVSNTPSPTDIDIIWNLAQQRVWLKIMKPYASLLKFRYPFYNKKDVSYFDEHKDDDIYSKTFDESGIKFVQNYNSRKLLYMKSLMMMQAFAPLTSAETRLVVMKKDIDTIVEYESHVDYESKLFFYNCVQRRFGYHINEYADKPVDVVKNVAYNRIGVDHCGDCALEANIWNEYNVKFPPVDVREEIDFVSLFLNRSRFGKHTSHGQML